MKAHNLAMCRLLIALHVATHTLRRCITPYKLDGADIATCRRVATWTRYISPSESTFACDLCRLHAPTEEIWVEGPAAPAVRAFERLAITEATLCLPGEDWDDVEWAAKTLLSAIPPCPFPPSASSICPRCLWADGLEPNGGYRTNTAFAELTEALAAHQADLKANFAKD